MKEFSIYYFTSSGMELTSLGRAVRALAERGLKIKVRAKTSSELSNKSVIKEEIERAKGFDAIILNLHGGKSSCPIFQGLIDAIGSLQGATQPYLHIDPTPGDEDSLDAAKAHSPRYGTKEWLVIHKYLLYGGSKNLENLLLYLKALKTGEEEPIPPPEAVPTEGIYHPDFDHSPTLQEYIAKKVDPKAPTIGLWFYQTYWLNDNLWFIDAIIREVESKGANVIPVFHQRFKDLERGNPGADEIVETYFKDGDKSRIDCLLNPLLFSLKMAGDTYEGLLESLDVPVLQAMVSLGTRDAWEGSAQGLTFMDVTYNAAQPEMDGVLICVPVATREEGHEDPVTKARRIIYAPIRERIKKLVDLALKWANLRRKPNREKRIAICFHHYPPRNDRVGCAVGLDSFESVKLLLDRLKEHGYEIEEQYASGEEIKERLLGGITPDTRWLDPMKAARVGAIEVDKVRYKGWFSQLPQRVKDALLESWGTPPGDQMLFNDQLLLPGILNGNVFIFIQPSRGHIEKAKANYHDPWLPPPHSYLATYWWIREVFRADAVVHVGKHGTLEWLPGKSLGLSRECYPDLAIQDIPNIYPYIINDPSEGTQAKRRSYACIIDHLTPVYTNADLYDDLATLDNLITEYLDARREDPDRARSMEPMIWKAVEEADLHHDLEITKDEALGDFDGLVNRLHEYLFELSDTMISDGLHILGEPPRGERLVEFLAQLTRLENGRNPSLRKLCIKSLGFDPDTLRGEDKRAIVPMAHEKAKEAIRGIFEKGDLKRLCRELFSGHEEEALEVLGFIKDVLIPKIEKTQDEMDHLLKALSGRFVPPGPSGAPTRGQAEILPTGRNFYSVDPSKIPTPTAWKRGIRLGDTLLSRILQDKGTYPETVGIIVYGGPTMRTRGEDVAEILWLMGVRPKWHKTSGKVVGIEVIPLEELGRPRIDVVPRVSGFFRDAFPNLMALMDEAARMVAALNEPPGDNILRKHVISDLEHYMKEGFERGEAWRRATFRVFGCPPGTYGAGVSELVEAKTWETRSELGDAYINYSAHAYGAGAYGEKVPEVFKRQLSRMDVTVKNEDSREYDMMSCTDYFNYYGGLIAAVSSVREELPDSYMGDTSTPDEPRIRSTSEEARHILRSRLLNPKWLKGLMRHGYKGAGDISHMMDVVFGWDATADIVEDWMYERIAHAYCFDHEMREWMKEVNPHALYNILERLLEAEARGMWDASKETSKRLRDMYLEMEGEMEDFSE